MLVDLLGSIERFLQRLDIYTKIPSIPAMTEILVKIMVELLSALGLVTKQIKQKWLSVFSTPFFFLNRHLTEIVTKSNLRRNS